MSADIASKSKDVGIFAGSFTGSVSSRSVDKPSDFCVLASPFANGKLSSAILSAEQANQPSKLKIKIALIRFNPIFNKAKT